MYLTSNRSLTESTSVRSIRNPSAIFLVNYMIQVRFLLRQHSLNFHLGPSHSSWKGNTWAREFSLDTNLKLNSRLKSETHWQSLQLKLCIDPIDRKPDTNTQKNKVKTATRTLFSISASTTDSQSRTCALTTSVLKIHANSYSRYQRKRRLDTTNTCKCWVTIIHRVNFTYTNLTNCKTAQWSCFVVMPSYWNSINSSTAQTSALSTWTSPTSLFQFHITSDNNLIDELYLANELLPLALSSIGRGSQKCSSAGKVIGVKKDVARTLSAKYERHVQVSLIKVYNIRKRLWTDHEFCHLVV